MTHGSWCSPINALGLLLPTHTTRIFTHKQTSVHSISNKTKKNKKRFCLRFCWFFLISFVRSFIQRILSLENITKLGYKAIDASNTWKKLNKILCSPNKNSLLAVIKPHWYCEWILFGGAKLNCLRIQK